MTVKSIFRNGNAAVSTRLRTVSALVALAAVLAIVAPVSIRSFSADPARAEPVAPTAGGSTFTDEQKKALGEIVKDYLVKNPEVLIEVQAALDEKAEKD